MFVRPCWRPTSPQDVIEIIDQNPWALLVSNGDEVPLATNLPLLLDHSKPDAYNGETVLVGHVARANQHARMLAIPGAKVLAIFEGPWSYVTASWYPNRDMPSTYYYTAVHCSGTVELQDEPALDESLERLVQRSESGYPSEWHTDEIPRSEITRRFAGIMGFRIHVNKIEAKFKLGQDEPLKDALAVAENLERQAFPADHAVASLIRKHNNARTE